MFIDAKGTGKTSSVEEKQYLIETDVLASFLTTPIADPAISSGTATEESLLLQALRSGKSYTTMLNAYELLRAATTPEEQEAVMGVFRLVRVLGFHARLAASLAEIAQAIETKTGLHVTDREAMILGMAQASTLTILTQTRFERYRELCTALTGVLVQDSISQDAVPTLGDPTVNSNFSAKSNSAGAARTSSGADTSPERSSNTSVSITQSFA